LSWRKEFFRVFDEMDAGRTLTSRKQCAAARRAVLDGGRKAAMVRRPDHTPVHLYSRCYNTIIACGTKLHKMHIRVYDTRESAGRGPPGARVPPRGRHAHDGPAQAGDTQNDLAQAREIHWLGQEAVGGERRKLLMLGIGPGEHHHRQLVPARLLADAQQHVAAVQVWELQVEQDEVRP